MSMTMTNENALTFIFNVLFICGSVWTIMILVHAYEHFKIILLSKYWSFASDDEFYQKLKQLLIEVNPNIIVFSNRNFAYKLKHIYYNQMDFIERSHFRTLVFQNGLKRRFDESLEIY